MDQEQHKKIVVRDREIYVPEVIPDQPIGLHPSSIKPYIVIEDKKSGPNVYGYSNHTLLVLAAGCEFDGYIHWGTKKVQLTLNQEEEELLRRCVDLRVGCIESDYRYWGKDDGWGEAVEQELRKQGIFGT